MLDRHDADPSAFRSRRRHSEMRESLSTTNRQRSNDMTQDRVLDGLLGPLTVAAWDGTAEERWATQQQVFAGYVLLRALADAPTVEAASQRAVPGAAAHRLRRWHAPARPGHHEERRRACRVRDAGDQAPPRRAAGPGRRPPAHDGAHRALPVPAPDRAPPRAARRGLREDLGDGVQEGWRAGPAAPRPTAHRRAQHGAPGRAPLRGNQADRPQDRERLPAGTRL